MSQDKCEACGCVGAEKYVHVHTPNGGLNLCAMCLANINGKNPEVKTLREALLGTATTKNQWGGPCWCRTVAMLYCAAQPQCRRASEALKINSTERSDD